MIAKKGFKILMITICLLAATLFFQSSFSIPEDKEYYSYVDSIDYTESLESLRNPERGFYNPIGYNLKVDNNQPLNPSSNLVHLRLGIGAFSSKNNGKEDLELSEDALNALLQTIKNSKDNNGSIILRLAYDNFNGESNKEPSFNMILKHIEQIGSILLEYPEVITNIELGFFGPWGEMHSSKICTNENVSAALSKLLEVTEGKIKVSVRTPGYYAYFREISRGLLDTDFPEKGTSAYQVGIYNDGYLGSETDLGTFANRNIEVKWLSNQAKHTFYGGELVANFATGTPLNTIEYLSEEAFLTHTTYLNPYWNNQVIEGFKNTPYLGEDLIYKNESAYKYIENHLGYRFVLRSSYLTEQEIKRGTFSLKVEIENVGFANLIREKQVSIILKNKDNIYELHTDLDATTWDSKTITEESLDLTLPDMVEAGTYEVYLRISEYGNIIDDYNYHCIQFANSNIYNEELGANYLGMTTIKEKNPTTTVTSTPTPIEVTSRPTPTPTSTEEPVKTPDPTLTLSPSETPVPTPIQTPKPTPIEIAISTTKPTSTPIPTPSQSTNNNKNEQESSIINNDSIQVGKGEPVTEPTFEEPKGNKKYQIYYYYDNVRDKTKTLTLYSPIGSIIDSYSDKVRDGYVLDKTENYPLTVTEDVNENIMKIYYIKESEKKKEPQKTPNTDGSREESPKKENSENQNTPNKKQQEDGNKPSKKNQVMTMLALMFDSLLFLAIMIMAIRLILKMKNERTYRN